jgi:hypothetical protein
MKRFLAVASILGVVAGVARAQQPPACTRRASLAIRRREAIRLTLADKTGGAGRGTVLETVPASSQDRAFGANGSQIG